jgi:hypothetical protein
MERGKNTVPLTAIVRRAVDVIVVASAFERGILVFHIHSLAKLMMNTSVAIIAATLH